MNLYLYGQETNLNDEQKIQLARTFKRVLYLDNVDYTLPIQDSEPKVIAADPDITGWDIPNNVIAQIPNLKAICLQTTGYEWVDGRYCREHNITVTNVPHYASVSVAEKCIFMALALACLLYTSPSPRDPKTSRIPSYA